VVVSIEQAADMVDLALHYRDKGVVAVDIAGDEMVPMHQLHIDAFKVMILILPPIYIICRELSSQGCTLLFMLGRPALQLMSNE